MAYLKTYLRLAAKNLFVEMKRMKDYFSRKLAKLNKYFSQTDTAFYFYYLKKDIKRTLDEYEIKNPFRRILLGIPMGLYFDGKATLGRAINRIDIIGSKIFEYPDSYYEKMFNHDEQ